MARLEHSEHSRHSAFSAMACSPPRFRRPLALRHQSVMLRSLDSALGAILHMTCSTIFVRSKTRFCTFSSCWSHARLPLLRCERSLPRKFSVTSDRSQISAVFTLSADTLARLARLQLDFDVDGYF